MNAFVKTSDEFTGRRTPSLTPSKVSADPKRPLVVHAGPLSKSAVSALPLESAAVVPLPSLRAYAATGPEPCVLTHWPRAAAIRQKTKRTRSTRRPRGRMASTSSHDQSHGRSGENNVRPFGGKSSAATELLGKEVYTIADDVYIPLAGNGTASSSRSTMRSAVTPSASA